MPASPRFAWLHGFSSSPASTKAAFAAGKLAERGIELLRPDLNQPAFFDLTVTRMLGQVEALGGPLALVGSSLGGYLAALFAATKPERVASLVLLAPAFELASRWQERAGAAALAEWRARGFIEVDHFARGRKERLSIAFLDDAAGHPAYPLPRAPTLVIHG